ncbi:hypothetical protein Hamer_G012353 [Homarus americanus]|uniref:Uncharacterized protein n=2 Tax=Homarus americanus TaxID=6706 RepID=A0A8J5K3W7_HOMAM|nr:hypothetical protein Hamer_G012353 [Homarus americanus]
MAAADEYSTTSHVLQLCLALQDRLEKVEKEVQSLKGENLALKLVLEEKKTFASVVKDGEVEVDSWKVVAASATKCTLKRHSAVDLNNRFTTLSDECEEGASNTTSATPSVSVERGSSAGDGGGRVVMARCWWCPCCQGHDGGGVLSAWYHVVMARWWPCFHGHVMVVAVLSWPVDGDGRVVMAK